MSCRVVVISPALKLVTQGAEEAKSFTAHTMAPQKKSLDAKITSVLVAGKWYIQRNKRLSY